VETRTRVDLPPSVAPPFEVYVNGVLQTEGVDYDRVGPTILFRRQLASEGRLGFWRWLSMFLGVAGTYRKHENVSVVYAAGDRRHVITLAPAAPE
jgi:hypothetical protein